MFSANSLFWIFHFLYPIVIITHLMHLVPITRSKPPNSAVTWDIFICCIISYVPDVRTTNMTSWYPPTLSPQGLKTLHMGIMPPVFNVSWVWAILGGLLSHMVNQERQGKHISYYYLTAISIEIFAICGPLSLLSCHSVGGLLYVRGWHPMSPVALVLLPFNPSRVA